MTVKIEYKNSEIKKPMQPKNISVDGLYDYASYASVLFEYSMSIFKNKFEHSSGKKCNLFFGTMKDRKRVYEKIKEDDILSASNVLDVLRATVTLNTVEDLLDFLKYTKTFSFNKKDFNSMALDKNALDIIRENIEENVKKEHLSEEETKLKVDGLMTASINKLKNNCKNMKELPITNVAIIDSFSLKVDEKQRHKYDFIPAKPRVKNSNYMDFKFYVCIPIPVLEK